MLIDPQGRNVRSIFRTKIGQSDVSVGRYTYGIENIFVRQWEEGACLTIGSFCSIADNINIFLGGNHRSDWATTFPFGHIYIDKLGGSEIIGHPTTKGNVSIGNDVWIAHGATIMSGVSIGNGAIIGANSHVVHDVKNYEIVGGNPATHIKYRFSKKEIELLLILSWWDLPEDDILSIARDISVSPSERLLNNLINRYHGICNANKNNMSFLMKIIHKIIRIIPYNP